MCTAISCSSFLTPYHSNDSRTKDEARFVAKGFFDRTKRELGLNIVIGFSGTYNPSTGELPHLALAPRFRTRRGATHLLAPEAFKLSQSFIIKQSNAAIEDFRKRLSPKAIPRLKTAASLQAPQPGVAFLSLSAELRNQIYDEMLRRYRSVTINRFFGPPALLSSNKQSRSEASPMIGAHYSTENTFAFDLLHHHIDDSLAFIRSLPYLETQDQILLTCGNNEFGWIDTNEWLDVCRELNGGAEVLFRGISAAIVDIISVSQMIADAEKDENEVARDLELFCEVVRDMCFEPQIRPYLPV